jgi:large subunit ribosomal protein L9
MKVILLRDVAKIGKRYEIVNVPDGFALNKLIPKKDAESATPANLKRVNNMRLKDKTDKEAVVDMLKKIVADLSSTPLLVPMQANEQGHLFQAVHVDDIVKAAGARGVSIDKDFLSIEAPIKSIGQHTINLKSQLKSFPLLVEVVAK